MIPISFFFGEYVDSFPFHSFTIFFFITNDVANGSYGFNGEGSEADCPTTAEQFYSQDDGLARQGGSENSSLTLGVYSVDTKIAADICCKVDGFHQLVSESDATKTCANYM